MSDKYRARSSQIADVVLVREVMVMSQVNFSFFFFFQAEDGIRDLTVTGVQTCALPICSRAPARRMPAPRTLGRRGGWCRAAPALPGAWDSPRPARVPTPHPGGKSPRPDRKSVV